MITSSWMTTSRRVAALGAAAILTALTVAVPAQATMRGPVGREPDPLRHAQRRRPRTSFNPSWSPTGRRIAFTDALFVPGKPAIGDIWTVRPDGRGRQQVSRSTRFEFRPDWGR